jgi:phage gp36-like protein
MSTFSIDDNVSAASTTERFNKHCCDVADEFLVQSRAEENERLKCYVLLHFVASSCCDQL